MNNITKQGFKSVEYVKIGHSSIIDRGQACYVSPTSDYYLLSQNISDKGIYLN